MPARLPLLRGGRLLKRWRYVGVFHEQLMACVALVRVGPFAHAFWAVLPAGEDRMRERTYRLGPRGGGVRLTPGRVRVRDRGVALELELEEGAAIHAACAHEGGGEVWTSKQAGVRARVTLALEGGPARELEALAVIDDTAGYHARHTEWWWSAGVGSGARGEALAWNLVAGVNDPPAGSERAVWVRGEPREVAPVRFARDLGEVVADDGATLRFSARGERRRGENLLIVSSDYRAAFGEFAGTLPGGIALARGLGVIEHHRAKW